MAGDSLCCSPIKLDVGLQDLGKKVKTTEKSEKLGSCSERSLLTPPPHSRALFYVTFLLLNGKEGEVSSL